MSLQTIQDRRHRFEEDMNKRQKKDVESIIRENALNHLPAKSILRFRAVCRDWKHFITNPFFNHNQSHSFCSLSGLFHQSQRKPPSFISLDAAAYGVPDPSLSFLPVQVNIKSSTNGLLCCQGQTGDKLYYICNPVNKEWKVLPKPNCNHGLDPPVVLVFKPSVLNFAADYKLICTIPSDDFPDATEFEIYSSETNSWKLSREICFNYKVSPGTGFYMNNMVYWQNPRGDTILSFDPINEHAVTHSFYGYGALIEMHGKLCCARVNNSTLTLYSPNMFENTMPMDARKNRTAEFSFPLDKTIVGNVMNAHVLPSVGGDALVIKVGGTIASYHIYQKELKVLSRSASGLDHSDKYLPYVNSLVSVSSR